MNCRHSRPARRWRDGHGILRRGRAARSLPRRTLRERSGPRPRIHANYLAAGARFDRRRIPLARMRCGSPRTGSSIASTRSIGPPRSSRRTRRRNCAPMSRGVWGRSVTRRPPRIVDRHVSRADRRAARRRRASSSCSRRSPTSMKLPVALNAKQSLHHCPVMASVVCRDDGGCPTAPRSPPRLRAWATPVPMSSA